MGACESILSKVNSTDGSKVNPQQININASKNRNILTQDKNTNHYQNEYLNQSNQVINGYNQEIKELTEKLNQKEKELNKYKTENKYLTDNLNNNVKELNKYKTENKFLSHNLNINTQELNIYKEKNKTLTDNLNSNIQELNKYKTQNQSLTNNLNNNIQELNQYKAQYLSLNNNLNNNINELNKSKAENETLMLKFKQINDNNNQFEARLNKEKALLDQTIHQYKDKENKYLEQIKELEKVKEQIEPILVGLDNIGATCYMNATLQSLSNTSKLTNYFLNRYSLNEKNKNKIMSNEYYKVVSNLWKKENNKKSYAPKTFKEVLSKENPLFEGIAANDSKDLINFLLERFHQELNQIDANNIPANNQINQVDQLDEQKMLNLFLIDFKIKFRSIISDLFYGVMETRSQCHGCKSLKYNFQVYSFVEFPLEQVNKFCFNNGLRNNYIINNNYGIPDVNLYECFNYYGNVELMAGDNQMFCNICHRNCDAFYSTNLYSAPQYMIINLNRGKGAVYKCNVIFPEKLNLFNFVSYKEGNTYFELYAVISHIGPSSMSGHFVAYCKNSRDKKWYKYNDSMVDECKRKDEYKEGMPYILFYQAL